MSKAKKENTSAKQPQKETAEANDPKVKAAAEKAAENIKKVKITGAVAWLGLPFNVGQEVEIGKHLSKAQAKELIEANRAEKI